MKTNQTPVASLTRELDPYDREIKSLDGKTADLIRRFRDLFREQRKDAESVQFGRERAVIVRSDHVIKIPLNEAGLGSNDYEASYQSEDIPLADCDIIWMDDLPVLKMERVVPVTTWKDLPRWTGFVDCCQVGYTKDGKLVAYDL